MVDAGVEQHVARDSAASGGPTGSVTLVLVSHDGAAWLPGVLDGIRAQTRAPDHVVAVDTGSRDGSPELVEGALGASVGAVVPAPASTGFPAALDLALDAARADDRLGEWVWVLHDDSAPAPGALAALLGAAERYPDAGIVGPKLREWPSLLRLVEVGVTISGTGRRETGLEAGEYDQGQHDEVRPVLAVNTAGMLVRRSVLEQLGGLDEELPVFGNDVDLGWRAAAAGVRTVVVPEAVVFHAEAAHRGLRRTALTGTHTHLQERRAALFTLLANSRPWAPVLQVPRLVLGTLLRMLGFLVVREPARALDDLAALLSVLLAPGALLAARRSRAAARVADPGVVRRLLAAPWVPYRHGLDLLGDLASALTQQAGDVAERRRAVAAGHDPSSFAARRQEAREGWGEGADGDAAAEDTGLVARFVTNPVAVLLAVVVLLALVGARHALGSVSGGGLSPAPGSVHEWWLLHVQARHPLVQGTSVPAPTYVVPLALLGTLLGGSAQAAVSLVLLSCVPVALWGTWRFLRVLGRLVSLRGTPRWLILWGSTTYALTPVVSGAWGDGRLGPVVAGALLPWLGHAALGYADPVADRRWRAGWRTGLLAALVVAFAPLTWWLLLLLVVGVVAAGLVLAPAGMRQRSVWGPLAAAPLVPLVLLAPWWLWSLAHGAGDALLLDVGRLPQVRLDPTSLLAGRFADLGAPRWAGLVLPGLALLALVPRRSRVGVTVCWLVAAAVAVVTALLAPLTLDLAATSTSPGLSLAPVLLQGAFVVAVVLAAQGLLETPGPRALPVRAGGAVLALAGLVVPVVGLGWWLAAAPVQLAEGRDGGIPAYMVQGAEQDAGNGILVVRGDDATGLRWTVRRGAGVTVGEDEVVALSAESRALTRDVRTLASRPTPAVVDRLAASGIGYVVLPAPADSDVAASLDATAGLVQASAENRSTRAWRVDRPVDAGAVRGRTSWPRSVAVGLQALAALVVLVLCAPTAPGRAEPQGPRTAPATPAPSRRRSRP